MDLIGNLDRAMLDKAFSDQLVPREPSDERAEALPERVQPKHEREKLKATRPPLQGRVM